MPNDPSYPISNLTLAVPELRRPFSAEAIRVKPLTKPGNDGKSAAAFYIDARLVAERLNMVVGAGGWSDEYDVLVRLLQASSLGIPVECRLTVLGVTKADVGQIAPSNNYDDKSWKSAYSDALKRAAVKFGVGAYLYAIGRWRAPVDIGQDGKARGFTKDGAEELLNAYRRWLDNDANTFGAALDHGDPDWEPFGEGDAEAERIPFGDEAEAAGGYS